MLVFSDKKWMLAAVGGYYFKDSIKQHLCIECLEGMHSTVQFIGFFSALTEGFARINKEGKNKGLECEGN